MDHIRAHYGVDYAPNTTETFRRQVLHQFVQAQLADYNPFEPTLPTNSPHAHYAVSEAVLTAIRAFGTERWRDAVLSYRGRRSRQSRQASQRERHRVPVLAPDGVRLQLSPGRHNVLQKAVVEQFGPRFAPGARLLYLGDTAQKTLVLDSDRLAALGVAITGEDKLPDVILHHEANGWLLLVEAVTSHGPVTRKRLVELEALLTECSAARIYVTAFPDLAEYRKHMKDIAWETEVWLSDEPDHLIHYDGDRHLEPRFGV